MEQQGIKPDADGTASLSEKHEDFVMSMMRKTLLAAAIVGAVALPLSSAQAWWGGPWGGYPGNGWGNNGWGNNNNGWATATAWAT